MMQVKINQSYTHCYSGLEWVNAKLPVSTESWLMGKKKSFDQDPVSSSKLTTLIESVNRDIWEWPDCPVLFFSDLHADTDAFLDSLLASGGISKFGAKDEDIELTELGHKSLFIIGGDCFDKGTDNLRLLRLINLLRNMNANIQLLAGNHDLRLLAGMRQVGSSSDFRTDHFFIRLGSKVVPLLKQISEEYLQSADSLRGIPKLRECKLHLFPQESWYEEFPRYAQWLMPNNVIEKELRRVREKRHSFERQCEAQGLSLRRAYAAVLKWRELFLETDGEFYWFYDEISLINKIGSFLFLHAGLDDSTAVDIANDGVDVVNQKAMSLMQEKPFEFYYGPFANTMRTKYRDTDRHLSKLGVAALHSAGIHIIVHGHQSQQYGQRIMMREGMVNFECDASLDQNTRIKCSLEGSGAAATVFHPDKFVLGISSDYESIKVFSQGSLIRKTKGSRGQR